MTNKKLSNLLRLLFLLICSIILVLILISSTLIFWRMRTNTLLHIIPLPIVIILNLLIGIIGIKINRHSNKAFITMLVIISFLEYLLWNIYASTDPVSDYRVLIEGAKKIVEGSFAAESFDKTSYFYFYNFQIGYTAYLALLMKIFGQGLSWLKLFDGIYMTLTSIMIYKIVSKHSKNDSGAIASLLYAMFIPNIAGSSIINNQHISTLLMTIAIYFILEEKTKFAIFSGISLGFMQIFRPVAVIIIIAAFLYYFVRALDKGNYTRWVKAFTLFVITFVLITRGVDLVLVKSGISPSPISQNNAKYFKFVLGLTGKGVYKIPTEDARKTQVYYDLKMLNFDYDKYNKESLGVIKESVKDYKHTLKFIITKMYNFMGDIDNQYNFALIKAKITKDIISFLDLGYAQYIILVILSLLSIAMKIMDRDMGPDINSILIIGFILVHVFIETQTRYRYETYVFLSILASQTLERLVSYDYSGLWNKDLIIKKDLPGTPLN